MYLAHLVKGCGLNDCDAASWYTDRVEAAAKGLSKAKDCSSAARPAIYKDQLCQFVDTFPFRDEFALPPGLGWISLPPVKSEVVPMRRKWPSGNTSEMGQASAHSVLGMVEGRLVLKPRRRRHVASVVILKRSFCCEGRDPHGEDLHIPQLLCPLRPNWPVVRGRVLVGGLISPSFQSPNLIRHLRSRGANLNWPPADKLGTHSLRRGAALALKPA